MHRELVRYRKELMTRKNWIVPLMGGIGIITAITAALAQGSSLDPKKAAELMELAGPDYKVMDMAFSADGKRLTVASDQAIGRVWDVKQGRIAVQLTGHQFGLTGVTYTLDGKSIVTMGADKLLKVWDAGTGKETSSVNLKAGNGLGDVVAMKDNRVIVAHAGLKIVDLKTGTVVGATKRANLVSNLALSPDGGTVLGSTGDADFTMWDTQTLETFRTLKGHTGQGFAVAYSADGKFLATGSSDKTARIWNAANGKEVRVLKGHDGMVRDVAFSPDSKILATASDDNTVMLWDVATGAELKILEGHKEDVKQLAWSRDGKMLASGDEGGVIKLWGNP